MKTIISLSARASKSAVLDKSALTGHKRAIKDLDAQIAALKKERDSHAAAVDKHTTALKSAVSDGVIDVLKDLGCTLKKKNLGAVGQAYEAFTLTFPEGMCPKKRIGSALSDATFVTADGGAILVYSCVKQTINGKDARYKRSQYPSEFEFKSATRAGVKSVLLKAADRASKLNSRDALVQNKLIK